MTPDSLVKISIGFLALAAFFAVLDVTAPIAIPATISLFLMMLITPLVQFLARYRIPRLLSTLAALALALLLLFTVIAILAVSLGDLQQRVAFYSTQMRETIEIWSPQLEQYGLVFGMQELRQMLDPSFLFRIASTSVTSFAELFKDVVIIFFITLFLSMEGPRLRTRLTRVVANEQIISGLLIQVTSDIRRYLVFKSLISLATGLLAGLFLFLLGVDFPLFCGLLTFVLNFIPTVGSIIATIPPLLIVLLQYNEPLSMLIKVLSGLVGMQVVIGNYLDPRIVGRSLNVSPLVIFGGMIFWGWLWGPAGMFLAVPIMVSFKALLRHLHGGERYASLLEG